MAAVPKRRKTAVRYMILKVQRSLCGTRCLMYSRDSSILKELPWNDVKNFEGIHGMDKHTTRFVNATVTDTNIHITGPAPRQAW